MTQMVTFKGNYLFPKGNSFVYSANRLTICYLDSESCMYNMLYVAQVIERRASVVWKIA